MTSVINVRNAFSYLIDTSSISYTRNYNFNSSTTTTLTLTLNNSGSDIPLTAEISASVPWIRVINPITGNDITYPRGNVVLQPSSSAFVNLLVDLPPELDSILDRDIYEYPDIHLRVLSGSFPIIPPSDNSTSNKNVITVAQNTYTIDPGERVQIDITVYDADGRQDRDALNVVWRSNNASIVQVEEPTNTEVDYNPYTPRIIRGISPGETTVTITAGPERETSITFIVRETSSSTTSTSSANNENSGVTRFDSQN